MILKYGKNPVKVMTGFYSPYTPWEKMEMVSCHASGQGGGALLCGLGWWGGEEGRLLYEGNYTLNCLVIFCIGYTLKNTSHIIGLLEFLNFVL